MSVACQGVRRLGTCSVSAYCSVIMLTINVIANRDLEQHYIEL